MLPILPGKAVSLLFHSLGLASPGIRRTYREGKAVPLAIGELWGEECKGYTLVSNDNGREAFLRLPFPIKMPGYSSL